MELHLFDEVTDVIRAFAGGQYQPLQIRTHRRGVKVWVGSAKPPREHYEAQLLARRHVDGVDGLALEIGFHAEHREESDNERAIESIARSAWKRTLGGEAKCAPFFDAPKWRRVSEAWIEPDLEDPELALAIGSRLVDFLDVLEPIRSA